VSRTDFRPVSLGNWSFTRLVIKFRFDSRRFRDTQCAKVALYYLFSTVNHCVGNFHCCTVHFHDSVTISYQQMHQIHLLFNAVLIIYIKIS
jgi:hypothetical protein